jgi:hypothetical protein
LPHVPEGDRRLFGPYASVPAAGLTWTRGQRKTFQSSELIARGFCGDCGTPLTFEAAGAAKYPPVASRQHPDHDTETWPPTR